MYTTSINEIWRLSIPPFSKKNKKKALLQQNQSYKPNIWSKFGANWTPFEKTVQSITAISTEPNKWLKKEKKTKEKEKMSTLQKKPRNNNQKIKIKKASKLKSLKQNLLSVRIQSKTLSENIFLFFLFYCFNSEKNWFSCNFRVHISLWKYRIPLEYSEMWPNI